jgi:hypothetical protein
MATSRGFKLWVGIPLLILGIPLALAGAFAVGFVGLDGRFQTEPTRLSADGVALVADSVQVSALPRERAFADLHATVRLDLVDTSDDVFVGVAPADDASNYLDGAAVDHIVDFDGFAGFDVSVRTVSVDGRSTVDPPGQQDFWVASVSGTAPRTLTWEIQTGDWWIVLMNADGSSGVDATVRASFDIPVLGPIALLLLLFGLAILIAGILLLVSAARQRRAGAARQPPPTPGSPAPTPSAVGSANAPPPPRPDSAG